MTSTLLIVLLGGLALLIGSTIAGVHLAVVLHELGHLAVALACRQQVSKFQLGAEGRPLFAFSVSNCRVDVRWPVTAGSSCIHLNVNMSGHQVKAVRETFVSRYGTAETYQQWDSTTTTDTFPAPGLATMLLIAIAGPTINLLTAVLLVLVTLHSHAFAIPLVAQWYVFIVSYGLMMGSVFIAVEATEDGRLVLSCIRVTANMR